MNPEPNILTRASSFWMVILIFLSGSSLPAATADNQAPQFYVRTWQTDDGLPRNTVTSIEQSTDGYLWLGTPYGLIRFDGDTFTSVNDRGFTGFSSVRARVLSLDSEGQLWIGTGTEGLIRLSDNGAKAINAENGLPHPTVNAICEDQHMRLWVATGDGQVSWIDGSDTVHPAGLVLGRQSSSAIQLVRDRAGVMWFAQESYYGQLVDGIATNITRTENEPAVLCPSRDGGIWMFSGKNLFRIKENETRAGEVLAIFPGRPDQATLLREDRQGNLWIGTRNQGIYRYANGNFVMELDTPHRIMAFFQDAEDNLWFGTDGGGLNRLRPKTFNTVSPHAALPSFPVVSVCKDLSSNVWLSPQGPGLTRWNNGSISENFPALQAIGTTVVLPNPKGGVWVGTVNHGLYLVTASGEQCLTEQNAFKNRQIRALHQDAQGNLWLGCLPDGLAQISSNKIILPDQFLAEGLPRSAILAIADDRAGNLWLGTITGDLCRYDGKQFVRFGKTAGLPGKAISALNLDTNGDLWIGTLGGGLGRYRNGQFFFYDKTSGLADDVIAAIVDIGDGYFWLGTERGIFRVKQQELQDFADGKRTSLESICYGRDDGLSNVEMVGGYQPAAWKTSSGEIWFSTSKGAVRVNPAELRINTRPPPLILEKILVDDLAITNHSNVKLRHDYRKLEFQYTAPSLVSSERIHFRRQLDGLDTAWVDAGSSRAAVYPQLPPGNYEFRFTACNSDGVWNQNPLTFTFVVTPAFWQTTWFRVLALLTFAGMVAVAVRYRYVQKMRRKLLRLEQAHAVEKERMRIARDIHDDLGARLTQLAFLSELSSRETGVAGKLDTLLKDIAQGSRQSIRSLEEIVWAVNPKKDSLPHLVDYLSHYANEFFRDTETRCRQDLPLIIPEIPLTAEVRHNLFLACKEALNNIRKHAHATEVWVRVTVSADELLLVIDDNGAGFTMPVGQPTGNGLANLQSRLTALGGRCQITSQPGRGTQVILAISLPILVGDKKFPNPRA